MVSSLIGSTGVRFSRAVMMVRGAAGVAESVNFYQNGVHEFMCFDIFIDYLLLCSINMHLHCVPSILRYVSFPVTSLYIAVDHFRSPPVYFNMFSNSSLLDLLNKLLG